MNAEASMDATPALAPLEIEAVTTRKIWTRIVPFVFVLFVINYIDRVNIGFAALTMNKELAITSRQYGFIAGIFFLGYVIFEIPSNLVLHRVGARVWIARILVSWGIVAILTGFAKVVFHLYALRFLLGVAEAGYYPGMVLYLTYWFRQRDLAQAVAMLNAGNPVASVIGAPISGVILDHVHWVGLSSWRWLLILEGIPAIVAGIATYVFLPNRPADAKFLAAAEKTWLSAELRQEEIEKLATGPITMRQALAHGRVWHLISIHFLLLLSMNAVLFWMPQVMRSAFQYSNTKVGLLVMIPYAAGVSAMIIVARSSDRSLERRYHAAVPQLVAALALLLLATITAPSPPLSVALWCFVAMGIWSYFGPFWSLPIEFLTGSAAAGGIALINSIANIGGFVGPYAFGAISTKTGSFHGGLLVAGISLIASATLILMLRQSPRMAGSKQLQRAS